MAVLGIQFVITLMVATILSRVGPHLSFARWLLTSKFAGLVRYIHPSDEELRQFAPAPRVDKKDRKKARHQDKINGNNGATSGIFNVPRNIDIQLETAPVDLGDVVQLRYYTEYQWLVDFSLYSILAYSLSELYIFLLPARASQDINLSLVWICLVLGFTYKILLSLNSLYFEGEEAGGERSLVLVMGFTYLLFAMLVLIVEEESLETGLDQAYKSFNQSAAAFLETNAGLDSQGPASKLVLKFFIALWCGLVGALFTFPGLRVARMHWDALRYHSGSVLLHLGFISPLLLTTLWVRPLTRDPLTNRLYKGMEAPLMTEQQFECMRLYLICAVAVLRMSLMPKYLQAYLNLAYDKVDALKVEAGKISSLDLQRLVIRVFYYLCVVALQYVTPIILILNLTFLYKTLGGGAWAPTITQQVQGGGGESNLSDISIGQIFNQEDTVEALKEKFSLAWVSLKNVFTMSVFRGILGFSTWWCCFVWFSSAAIGMGYQSYFTKV